MTLTGMFVVPLGVDLFWYYGVQFKCSQLIHIMVPVRVRFPFRLSGNKQQLVVKIWKTTFIIVFYSDVVLADHS